MSEENPIPLGTINELLDAEAKTLKQFQENPTLRQALANFFGDYLARAVTLDQMDRGLVKGSLPPMNAQFFRDIKTGAYNSIRRMYKKG